MFTAILHNGSHSSICNPRTCHTMVRGTQLPQVNIIRVIKSGRITHVVHMEWRNSYRVMMGKHEGKDCLEDLGIDTRVILTWMLMK
jgi:hypothetical protein